MFTDLKIPNSFTLENSFFKHEQDTGNTEQTKCQTDVSQASPCKHSEESIEDTDNDQESSSDDESLCGCQKGEQYDRKNGYYHFTAEDHVMLGEDLVHTLHKTYVRFDPKKEQPPTKTVTKRKSSNLNTPRTPQTSRSTLKSHRSISPR